MGERHLNSIINWIKFLDTGQHQSLPSCLMLAHQVEPFPTVTLKEERQETKKVTFKSHDKCVSITLIVGTCIHTDTTDVQVLSSVDSALISSEAATAVTTAVSYTHLTLPTIYSV